MKDKVQRFTPVEIGYHACQAVLYLVLFVSGGLLLLQRLFRFETVSYTALASIHRISGLVMVGFLLQAVVISIFSKNYRIFWGNIGNVIKWNGCDLLWLIKTPLHVICHRITLPPADRFNPGQKLHLLTIFLVLIGFSVSGLLIILLPGALAPWIFHLLCFVPAEC